MAELIEAESGDGVNWSAVDAIVDGGGAGDGEQATEAGGAPRMTPGQELAGLLQALAQIIKPVMPTVAAIYTPETCAGIGAGIDPVCQKYGWLQGGFQWGAELQAAIVVVPIVIATADAIQRDVSALRAAKAAREAAQEPRASDEPAES